MKCSINLFCTEPKNDVSNGQLMQSLMSRLCSVEKKLASSEELNEEKVDLISRGEGHQGNLIQFNLL